MSLLTAAATIASVYTASSTLAAAPEATTGPTDATNPPRPSAAATKIIAIALPTVFALILVLLVVIAFIMPRFTKSGAPLLRQERQRRRMNRLNKDIKVQEYKEWYSALKDGTPSSPSTAQAPLCVICLDSIEQEAKIRGLGCLHVFHQECLDDWFSRFNNHCPLCHRPILRLSAKEDEMDAEDRRMSIPTAMIA